MKKRQINGLHLWQFENLANKPSIKHFVTDRSSASENGEEFTLSYSSSPDREAIRRNRQLLATALGISESRLYFPSQVHKTRIAHVTSHTAKEALMETDALITAEKNVCIAVMSADCVPILLYDPRHRVVGAVHAGWRGTVARILEKTLLEMHSTFGTRGEDLLAAIGPSVCQEAYEVGEEVVHAVHHAFGKDSGLMIPQPEGKARLDLWRANQIQLQEFGVKETHIAIANLCTVKNNRFFFSARKGDSGRFAAGIMMVD